MWRHVVTDINHNVLYRAQWESLLAFLHFRPKLWFSEWGFQIDTHMSVVNTKSSSIFYYSNFVRALH